VIFPPFLDDQIAFPETGHRAIVGLGRPLADVDHVGDRSPAQGRPGPGRPPRPTLPQGEGELGAQLAPCLQIQCLVNGLVGHSHLPVIGIVLFQSGADLLRGPFLCQALVDRGMESG
jgi:hypothetical protein